MSLDRAVLVNGLPDACVSPSDRGFTLGDGVFRTLRLEAGKPVWWEEHFAKLMADCQQLDLVCPSRAEWEQDIAWLSVRWPDAVLRLTVTRGPGPRGYRLPEAPYPTRIATASPLPELPDPLAESGVTLRVCDLRLGRQPRLAGAKHLNRLENVLARAEWDDPAIDEGLLLDEAGWVVSGVMSNLFLWHEGVLSTPRLYRCGVSGVTRARLMRRALAIGLTVRETDLTLDSLLQAEAVFLTNSLIRLRFVAKLGERHWPRAGIYDVLREALCGDD